MKCSPLRVEGKSVFLRKMLQDAVHQLDSLENPRLEAEILLAHLLRISRIELYTRLDEEWGDFPLHEFQTMVSRRAHREPLAYIIGRREFWSLDFMVTPQVLIPRPETEFVIEAALKYMPERARVIDVGTGSGNLAVCLAREIRGSRIYALDISEAALQVARRNAARHGVGGQITFLRSDLLSCFASGLHSGSITSMSITSTASTGSTPSKGIDGLVANPPYIPSAQIPGLAPDVCAFEPRLALDGGADGLDCYRRLFLEAKGILKTGGWLIMEMGYGQSDVLVREIHDRGGYEVQEIIPDYAGIDRVIVVRVTDGG